MPLPRLTFDSQPTAQTIIRRAIASTENDWKALAHFSYVERDEDIKGEETTSKTYKVLMIDGSPYDRSLTVNGVPLSSEQDARECEQLRKEIARRANESPAARDKRRAEFQNGRSQVLALFKDMVKAFDFRLVGDKKVAAREVYVIEASPRSGYQPTSRETRILTAMEGTLWIDKSTSQWVRAETVACRPVSTGWFIAQVLPGTSFRLDQSPITQGCWLPTDFSYEVRARIFWWQKNYVHRESYSDYRPVTALSQPEECARGSSPDGGIL